MNYKNMYYTLFNTLTDAIEILQKAQQEGERLFIEEVEKPKNKRSVTPTKRENTPE